MTLPEHDRIEIGATVTTFVGNGPYVVVGEIYWGMYGTNAPPRRKLFLYDAVNGVEKGEYSEILLTKVETTNED